LSPKHAIHEFAGFVASRFPGQLFVFPEVTVPNQARKSTAKTLAAVPGHPSVRGEFGGAIGRKFGKAREKRNSESEAPHREVGDCFVAGCPQTLGYLCASQVNSRLGTQQTRLGSIGFRTGDGSIEPCSNRGQVDLWRLLFGTKGTKPKRGQVLDREIERINWRRNIFTFLQVRCDRFLSHLPSDPSPIIFFDLSPALCSQIGRFLKLRCDRFQSSTHPRIR
jgi:hypothetical protein